MERDVIYEKEEVEKEDHQIRKRKKACLGCIKVLARLKQFFLNNHRGRILEIKGG